MVCESRVYWTKKKCGAVWRPTSYCLDFDLKNTTSSNPQGATHILEALEAYRHAVQKIEVFPHGREMAALTWLGAYLSGNRKAKNGNGLVAASQLHWL
jgi:hypothetical protein